jgi:hypothetical protein
MLAALLLDVRLFFLGGGGSGFATMGGLNSPNAILKIQK